jgi:hypothetical protein
MTGVVVGLTGLMGMFATTRQVKRKRKDELLIDSDYGNIAGVIPTNSLFNWVRVGIGAAGLLASRDEKTAVIYNRTVAASYAGMAVMGMIPKADTMFGLMPIFGGNVALHAGTAAAELLTEGEALQGAYTAVTDKIRSVRTGRVGTAESFAQV